MSTNIFGSINQILACFRGELVRFDEGVDLVDECIKLITRGNSRTPVQACDDRDQFFRQAISLVLGQGACLSPNV